MLALQVLPDQQVQLVTRVQQDLQAAQVALEPLDQQDRLVQLDQWVQPVRLDLLAQLALDLRA